MSSFPKDLKIEIVLTGNELLDGTTLDRHTQYLAERLRKLGFQIEQTCVVPDNEDKIRWAITEAALRSSAVIVTGGLGPTSDDLTLEVAAKAFGSNLVLSKRAQQNVMKRLKKLGRSKANESHRKMFFIPKGSKVLSNSAGAAPAIQWEKGDCSLFFLPGVPLEFRSVLDQHVLPWFEKRAPRQMNFLFVLKTFGWAESDLNALVKQMKIPSGVSVGFRTTLPENHIKIFVQESSKTRAQKKTHSFLDKLRRELGDKLFGENEISFEESVFQKLLAKKSKVAIAESCTGGLISSMLTQVPGSSRVLDRAFITYSNEAKIEMLGVRQQSLQKYGAVSREVALEMAKGAFQHSNANRAVAVTGIAGPSGGTKTKPVGTIWMARALKNKKAEAKLLQLSFDRNLNQRYTAYAALHWLSQ